MRSKRTKTSMAKKMAAKKLFFCCFLLYISFIITSQQENTLNVPQVLLPYVTKGSIPTTFVLKAYKGCFKWTSSKPQIASVSAIVDKNNDEEEELCSQSALVTVKHKSPEEEQTVILAEEEGTGLTLRCDVFVDSIHLVEVATTTRELLLGESPEVFDIYAYDKEGNLFSSLGSENFEWSFLPAYEAQPIDPRHILRLLWFQDSSYDTTKDIYGLEEKNGRGSSALVEGIRTGEAMVSAKLSHPQYQDVKPTSVKLTVIDNVMLYPSISYILINQMIKYNAMQLRRGERKDILLPSTQYSIKVLHGEIGRLSEQNATVYGLKLGETKVQLIDRNMIEAQSSGLPTANLHVVEPAKIGFTLNFKDPKVWVLEVGRFYYIHVKLYDNKDNSIQVTDHTVMESSLSNDYFSIITKSDNSSYFHVKAAKVGKTTLTGRLLGIQYPPEEMLRTKDVYGEQVIEIHEPITVSPKMAVFPWQPSENGVQNYKYQFKAQGGSGGYTWSSLNTTVAMVTKRGVVNAGSAVGEARVRVKDARNPAHLAYTVVKVLPPEQIVFVEGVVEVEMRNTLDLPLNVIARDDKEKLLFTDCRNMKLKVTFSDSSVFQMAETQPKELVDIGCTQIRLAPLKIGHSTVTVTYQYADVILKANIVVASYLPLKVIDPVEMSSVALEASKKFVAIDGPLPWVLDASGFYEVISAEEEDWVQVKKSDVISADGRHYFEVTCLQAGSQILTIEVGNMPTANNNFPAKSRATTSFTCALPSSLKLIPAITYPTVDGKTQTIESCRDEAKSIYVRNNQLLKVNVNVYDARGVLLKDVSSLELDWSTDNELGSVAKEGVDVVARADDLERNGRKQLYKEVQLHEKVGMLTVKATIKSYKHSKKETTEISATLRLQLVKVPELYPNPLSMFAHAEKKLSLFTREGTGRFVVKSDSPHIATVQLAPPESIAITSFAEGKFLVKLVDTCLDKKKPIVATVLLSDIYDIRLTVKDKVELGEIISAKCEPLDMDGNRLDLTGMTPKLKQSLRSTSDIISIKEMDHSQFNFMTYMGETDYQLTGKSIGLTSITCQATGFNGRVVSSKPVEVQVFSAIQLQPKHLVLIVRSQFQVHSTGGPRPHSSTVFRLDNQTVADVSSSGLVSTKVVGITKLTGEARGFDSNVGKEVTYSEDTTRISVVQLKGFKIKLNSLNFVTDSEVGILSVGITDEGPFTFATSQPYLRFHWSTTNHNVAVIESLHKNNDVLVSKEKDFRATLRTTGAGVVNLQLRVEVLTNNKQVHAYAQLEDTVEIIVTEKLKIVKPTSGSLLLPYNAKYVLKTTRDPLAPSSYTLMSSCNERQPIVEMLPGGMISSLLSPGNAVVIVTVHEESGFNQTAILHVEVRPVSTITFYSSSSNSILTNSDLPAFPLGSTILFNVLLNDKLGRAFDVASIPIKYRTSRYVKIKINHYTVFHASAIIMSDIVQVALNTENATLNLRAANLGETILKVWNAENEEISDYVRIRVNAGITPDKVTLTLGTSKCFSSNAQAVSGVWSSSSNVLSIDQKSGTAVAMTTGTTIVHFNANNLYTYAEVTVVLPTSNPTIDYLDYQIVTNSGEKFFPFTFTEAPQVEGDCTPSDMEVAPFKCGAKWRSTLEAGVDVSDIFIVKAVYRKGVAGCLFTPVTLTDDMQKFFSSTDRELVLTVDLSDGRKVYSSDPINIKFFPTLMSYTKQLHLAFEQKKTVEIFGPESQLANLKVESGYSGVEIRKLPVGKTSRKFEISLKTSPSSDTNTTITFSSGVTSHTITAWLEGTNTPVQCAPAVENLLDILPPTTTWVVAYTVMIATVVLLILMYHFVMKQPTTPRSHVMVSPYVASPYVTKTSPPPYQPSPHTSASYGTPKHNTPQRPLYSVSSQS